MLRKSTSTYVEHLRTFLNSSQEERDRRIINALAREEDSRERDALASAVAEGTEEPGMTAYHWAEAATELRNSKKQK